MARDQQYGVFQLALVAVQRALAEIADHDRRADGNRCDQKNAAGYEPADRSAGKERFQIERAGTVRHCREVAQPTPERNAPAQHGNYLDGMEVRLGSWVKPGLNRVFRQLYN